MRYLLCRPSGGLNDMLIQIERCCQYAEKTGRIVIVDTNSPYTIFFRDDFSNYFESRNKYLLLSVESVGRDVLNNLETFPPSLSKNIFEYEPFHLDGYYYEKESKELLSFDFTKNYPHPLLVHEQCGGGDFGHMTLLRLKLKDHIISKLLNRLSLIDKTLNYHSIHIRNTGYTTNYLDRIDSLKQALGGEKIFLATDNIDVLDAFKKTFEQDQMFNFSKLQISPDLSTSSERMTQDLMLSDMDIKEKNEDAILDLLVLALAKQFHYFPLDQSHAINKSSQPKFSGFTVLANNLHSWKIILKSLIDSENIIFGLN